MLPDPPLASKVTVEGSRQIAVAVTSAVKLYESPAAYSVPLIVQPAKLLPALTKFPEFEESTTDPYPVVLVGTLPLSEVFPSYVIV